MVIACLLACRQHELRHMSRARAAAPPPPPPIGEGQAYFDQQLSVHGQYVIMLSSPSQYVIMPSDKSHYVIMLNGPSQYAIMLSGPGPYVTMLRVLSSLILDSHTSGSELIRFQ